MTEFIHPVSWPSGVDSPMLNLGMIMEDGDGDVGTPNERWGATVVALAKLTARGRIPAKRFDSLGFNGDLGEDPFSPCQTCLAPFKAGVQQIDTSPSAGT